MRRRILMLATFLMFALLVLTLDVQSLWWDEGISLHLSTSSWAEIVADRATNIHPPLYFFALKAWIALVGANAFTGRLFSVLAVVLIPALAFRFVERRLHVRVPWYGAFILAFTPPLIVYGQETRAYAWLALFWMLLIDRMWYLLSVRNQSDVSYTPLREGILTGFLEVCFVLFHYTAIFGVVIANLVFLVDFLKSRNRPHLCAWLVSLAIGVAGGMIWLFPVMRYGLNAVTQHAGISNVLAEPVAWDYVLRLLATFQFFGVPSLALAPLLRWMTGALLATAILALALTLTDSHTRRTALLLGAVWLLPFLAAPFIWSSSPQSHPRYLMPYVLGGWLLFLWLTGIKVVPQVLRGLLSVCVIALSGVGLFGYITDEALYKSDVRALAAILRDSDGDAVVIVPATDWSLAQYDTGNVDIVMVPNPTSDFDAWYAANIATYGTVYLMDYGRDVLDTAHQLRSTLANRGWLEQVMNTHGVFLEQYRQVPIEIVMQDRETGGCTDDGLCLESARVPENAVSGAQVGIHLRWQVGQASINNRYAVALRLYAASGALVASIDDLLITTRNQPTDYWPIKRVIETYHILNIPTGALPQGYTLKAGVYEVKEPDQAVTLHWLDEHASADMVIGEVTPLIEPWRMRDDSWAGVSLDVGGLPATLGQWQADRSMVSPGESIFISLYWLARDTCIGTPILIQLVDADGADLTQVAPWQDFCDLPSGRPLTDVARLDIPAAVPGGTYELVLSGRDVRLTLGEITVSDTPHSFELPDIALAPVGRDAATIATLIGYTVGDNNPTAVRFDDPLYVTLVWQAQGDAYAHNLKVFVHLYAPDGSIVAQHDGVPVDWSRPTTGWVEGEYIVDTHTLQWQREYQGNARLAVGLYDPVSGERVMWDNGEDVLSLADIQIE